MWLAVRGCAVQQVLHTRAFEQRQHRHAASLVFQEHSGAVMAEMPLCVLLLLQDICW
jgi:hypothetical protein